MEIFDVAIIGSGPAGLTAGLYTSRANLKTIVFAGEKWGGQLMQTTLVENYPGFPDGVQGPDLMEKMKNQTAKFGTKIVLENANKVIHEGEIFLVNDYQSKSVIIATGADTKWLGLPNEQRLIGHGVSSCAPCDGFFFKNKKIAVVGGGDSAMEEALYLTRFASEITVIHRSDTLRASKVMQDRTKTNPKIKFLFNTEIADILGQDKVEGLAFKNGEKMPIEGVFIAIGHKPNSEIFGELVEIDERGYILKPKVPGIFVAGDVSDHTYKQAVTAAGFGCMAAMDAEKWLENH